MAVKQNAFGIQYPLAAQKVYKSIYVDDGLTGAESIPEAIHLQKQLQELFYKGLRKRNSNEPEVLNHLPAEMKKSQSTQTITQDDQYTKTL